MNAIEDRNSCSHVNLSKGKRRSRTTFDPAQIHILEEVFESTHYPDIRTRDKLAGEIKLPEARIQVSQKKKLYFEKLSAKMTQPKPFKFTNVMPKNLCNN